MPHAFWANPRRNYQRSLQSFSAKKSDFGGFSRSEKTLDGAMANQRTRSQPVPEMMQGGVWVFESYHNSSFTMPASRHSFPQLLYFREGKGYIDFIWAQLSERYLCAPGECVIVPANVDHVISDEPGSPLSLYGLAVDPQKIAVCSGLGQLLPSGPIPRQRSALLDIGNRLRRLLYLAGSDTPVSKLSTVASAIELFAGIAQVSASNSRSRKPTSKGTFYEIDDYIRWLESNFFERVSLDAAANACGFSRRKFTEVFKQRTGQTWLNYLQRLRVNHALALLRETDSQVTSIAFQCGFEDLSTFYRVFNRIAGTRPLELRAAKNQ